MSVVVFSLAVVYLNFEESSVIDVQNYCHLIGMRWYMMSEHQRNDAYSLVCVIFNPHTRSQALELLPGSDLQALDAWIKEVTEGHERCYQIAREGYERWKEMSQSTPRRPLPGLSIPGGSGTHHHASEYKSTSGPIPSIRRRVG